MKIAVTGATGFLGSHLAQGMLADGHQLTLLARSPAKLIPALQSCRVARGDLLDPASMREAFAGAEVVIHSAAYVGEWGPRDAYYTANVDGTRNVVDACLASGVKRLVHVSTNSVYGEGDRDNVALPEETPYRKNGKHYGDSKIEAEALVFRAHEAGQLIVTAIRPTMIWGPRDRQFLPKIIDAINHGVMMYLGGGRKLVGLAHVDNIVTLLRLILANPVSHGRAYNIDDDDRRTMRDLCRALCARLGKPAPWLSVPTSIAKALAVASETAWMAIGAKSPPLLTRMGVGIVCYDNDVSVERAKRELGYQPQDLFESRLDDYLRSYRAGE